MSLQVQVCVLHLNLATVWLGFVFIVFVVEAFFLSQVKIMHRNPSVCLDFFKLSLLSL